MFLCLMRLFKSFVNFAAWNMKSRTGMYFQEEMVSSVHMCTHALKCKYECIECYKTLFEIAPKNFNEKMPIASFGQSPTWFFEKPPKKNDSQTEVKNVDSALDNRLLLIQNFIEEFMKERDHEMVWDVSNNYICIVHCTYKGCLI